MNLTEFTEIALLIIILTILIHKFYIDKKNIIDEQDFENFLDELKKYIALNLPKIRAVKGLDINKNRRNNTVIVSKSIDNDLVRSLFDNYNNAVSDRDKTKIISKIRMIAQHQDLQHLDIELQNWLKQHLNGKKI